MKYLIRILIVLGFIPICFLWLFLTFSIMAINVFLYLPYLFIVKGSIYFNDILDKWILYSENLLYSFEEKLEKKGWV